MDTFQVIARVLSGVVLLLWTIAANAQTVTGSCPTGQAAQLRVTSSTFYSGLPAKCTVGQVFNGTSSIQSSCFYPVDTALGGTPPNDYYVVNLPGPNPATVAAGTGSASYDQYNKRTITGQASNQTLKVVVQSMCAPCPSGQSVSNGQCVLNPCFDTTTTVHTGSMFRLGLYVGGGTSPAPTETCGNDNCQIQEVSPSGKALSIAMSGINVKTGDVGTSSSVWKRTGAACSAQGEIVTPTAQELSANGNTVKPGPGAQCGFFNGEYYCAGASPPPAGGCVTTAGGQAFCTSAAASPPAPKNPATGVKAAPDSTLAVRDGGNTTTIEHFSAVTVSNSGGASGGTAGGATGGTSSGSTGGSTSGGSTGGTSGGITGGGDCVIEPACDGGDAVQCFIAKQSWRDACNAGQSVTGGTTCDAPPVCTGDPVGCYQAEAAWHTACAANIPTQAQATDAINQGFGVSEITEGSLLPVHSTVDGAGWFSDAMATAGGGMCLPDIHINLPQVNADVTIPLEHACSIVKLLRALVLISAAFVAFRIYMDGFN